MKLYLLHMAIFRSFLFHHHYSAREWDDRIITFVYVLISAATENTICILLHVCFRVGIMRGLWTAFPFVASYMRAHAHGKNILQRNICTKNIQRGEKNVRRLVVFQFSLLLVCSTFGIAAEKVYIWLARLHTLVHSHCFATTHLCLCCVARLAARSHRNIRIELTFSIDCTASIRWQIIPFLRLRLSLLPPQIDCSRLYSWTSSARVHLTKLLSLFLSCLAGRVGGPAYH